MKKITNFLLLLFFFSGGVLLTLKFNSEISEICKNDLVCEKYFLQEKISFEEIGETETVFPLEKLKEVYEIIKEKGVDFKKLENEKKLEENLISGLVRTLEDPYSIYLAPKENKNFKDDLAGNFEGIGAELQMKNELITVVSPLKNSPAIKAGLSPDDVILKVDSESVAGWDLTSVVKKIRGPRGEVVTLTVFREGEREPLDIKITRDTIHLSSVEFEMKEDGIGYISVNQFGDSTVKEFMDGIRDLFIDGAKKLVLDFRFNGGGYLDGAVFLASPFLEPGDTITTIRYNGFTDLKKALILNFNLSKIPTVVLINGGSASASEIMAGALRDHQKAILVGEKSFGKGSVQELISLPGESSLKLTTAKWYTPNDQNIHELGITPDVVVPRTYEDMKNSKDPQLDKAIELLKEGNFERFFLEKISLTGSSVLEFNGSGSLIAKGSGSSLTGTGTKN